ncbi:MAG TPA: PEP-CTERM sorting domain-containing protein [Candidatus Paceibacterota bacterium]|nr:PEP-CTERM sorting domain-containing protein [Candidatus Paceibacterota bacterium]
MKKTILLAALVTASSLAANAQNVISWAYNNGQSIPANGTAGVVSAINWNLTGDTGSLSLSLNNSTASGTTLSLAGGFGAWGIGGVSAPDADGTYNKAIFDGYYNSLGSTLTLGNIPFANYSIYVYFSSDVDGRTGTVSDGTTTYSFTTMAVGATAANNAAFTRTTDTGTGNPSADYAIFENLSGSSKTFTIANTSDGMGFAGIQIVGVPEPSTMALAGLSVLGLAISRRRSVK